jgi:hypothetical protein
MASLRPGMRRDGSTYVQVLYRLDGKQSSTSFEDLASAKRCARKSPRVASDAGAAGLRPSLIPALVCRRARAKSRAGCLSTSRLDARLLSSRSVSVPTVVGLGYTPAIEIAGCLGSR